MASLILLDRVSGADTTPARKHVGQAYIFINVKGGNCYSTPSLSMFYALIKWCFLWLGLLLFANLQRGTSCSFTC